MRNHISDKCIACGPEFQPPVIFQRVTQYNFQIGSNPKVDPNNWKPNPLIDQHHYHHTSCPIRPKIKCTDTSSEEQQQHLSGILSSLYVNDSTKHEPTLVPTPYSPCVTYNNYSIDTGLQTDSFTPQITEFSVETPTVDRSLA